MRRRCGYWPLKRSTYTTLPSSRREQGCDGLHIGGNLAYSRLEVSTSECGRLTYQSYLMTDAVDRIKRQEDHASLRYAGIHGLDPALGKAGAGRGS